MIIFDVCIYVVIFAFRLQKLNEHIYLTMLSKYDFEMPILYPSVIFSATLLPLHFISEQIVVAFTQLFLPVYLTAIMQVTSADRGFTYQTSDHPIKYL